MASSMGGTVERTREGSRDRRYDRGGAQRGADMHQQHHPKKLPKVFDMGETLRGRWTIKGELGHGGFGYIYLAFDGRINQDVAVKAAVRNREKDNARMYIEFRIIQRASELKLRHFVAFYGCGEEPIENPRINFIVMQVVSRNLTDRRRAQPNACLSRGTALRTAYQATEALRDLHNTLGYIHRDIKPSNMAFGAADQYKRIMYLFDFGLARCWLDKNTRQPLPQRPGHVGFRGTARYASIRCNQRMDQCRADDIVSVFFGTLELMNGQLPWRTLKDDDIGPLKQEYTRDDAKYAKLCGSRCPPLFRDVGRYLLGLTFESEPNYQYILDSINKCLSDIGVTHNSPLEWEQMDDRQLPSAKTARTQQQQQYPPPNEPPPRHAESGVMLSQELIP